MLVATGILCMSHRRSIFISLGSCGFAVSGSRKNKSKSTSLQAMRAAICWSPPCGPLKNRCTCKPVASETSLPVVPVAQANDGLTIRNRQCRIVPSALFWRRVQSKRYSCPYHPLLKLAIHITSGPLKLTQRTKRNRFSFQTGSQALHRGKTCRTP